VDRDISNVPESKEVVFVLVSLYLRGEVVLWLFI